MKMISFENKMFLLNDDEKQVILLNSYELLANKSRLPMHTLKDNLTIPKLILALKEQHEEISKGTEEQSFPVYLLDILMTSYLIRTSAPVKVLEIGAVSGILSYHLATLMGELNKESTLCCVSNIIGNESANHWLDRISMVEQPPNLSLIVSDYADTQLASENFDIVVINGTVWFDKPFEILREAERLLKKDGILICHIKKAPLLESSFKLLFSERQEYELSPLEKILITISQGESWGKEIEPILETEVSKLLGELLQMVKTERNSDEIRPFIHIIDQYIDKAIKNCDIKMKVELLQLKELILDYMLNIGKEFGEFYKEKLILYVKENSQIQA